MKRNAREREHELQFASVLDSDTGGLLRLIRPVVRRIARRHVNSNIFFRVFEEFLPFRMPNLVEVMMMMMMTMTTMTMTMMMKTMKMPFDELDISIHLIVHPHRH